MKELINFFFETGMLKHAKRSGWWLINVKDPESVAEHSLRTAMIGYFLAKTEGVDASKVVLMCLFHDVAEARINDPHKVGQRYVDPKEGEKKALIDQMSGVEGSEILGLMKEFQEQKTAESIVAKDADRLECAVQAKEYIDQGYAEAQNWIDNVKTVLKLKSSKKLVDKIEKTSSNDWWKGLKKID